MAAAALTMPMPTALERLPSEVFSSDESSSPTSPESITNTLDHGSTDTPTTSSPSSVEPESYFAKRAESPERDRTPPHLDNRARSTTTASAPPDPETAGTPRHRRQLSSPGQRAPIKTSSHGRLTETALDGPDLEGGHRRLNEYTLVRTIGKGSFGVVELGRHDDGREFAIKEYSKARMRKRAWTTGSTRNGKRGPRPRAVGIQNDGLELVKTEIAILKKCAHPNICSLTEVIDTDGDSVFYVMDLCKGGPVMNVTVGEPTEPLPDDEARNIMQQVILGVEYLHCNEIIHRDIKPDNILFVEEGKTRGRGQVRIVDFGTSEHFAKPGDDTMHTSAGSPAFLAPELCIAPDGAHGKAADIWACGVTLYALVTGSVPFDNPHPLALSESICNDPAAIPKHLPEELKDLLRKMLHKSPTARITMNDLRVHPWVTNNGKEPLPSTTENVSPFEAPSPEEIARAVAFRSTATVLRAVRKFKRHSSSSSSSDSDVRSFGALRLDGGNTVTSPKSSPRMLPTSPRIDEEPAEEGTPTQS